MFQMTYPWIMETAKFESGETIFVAFEIFIARAQQTIDGADVVVV